jgi:hypothetical protein
MSKAIPEAAYVTGDTPEDVAVETVRRIAGILERREASALCACAAIVRDDGTAASLRLSSMIHC